MTHFTRREVLISAAATAALAPRRARAAAVIGTELLGIPGAMDHRLSRFER